MPGRKVLLVEGSDDKHVLKHICGNRGIPHLDEVKPHNSVEQLIESFPIQLRASTEEGDVVGMVVDADTDLTARWQAIRTRLIQLGYQNVPVQPDPEGTVVEPPPQSILPKTGVWIMPNNQTPGILENFLDFLIPESEPLFDHVKFSVCSVPEQRFSDLDKPKAVIHTWLAWQSEPGLPYGTAITARFLDPNVAQADILVSWLARLFHQPGDAM